MGWWISGSLTVARAAWTASRSTGMTRCYVRRLAGLGGVHLGDAQDLFERGQARWRHAAEPASCRVRKLLSASEQGLLGRIAGRRPDAARR